MCGHKEEERASVLVVGRGADDLVACGGGNFERVDGVADVAEAVAGDDGADGGSNAHGGRNTVCAECTDHAGEAFREDLAATLF